MASTDTAAARSAESEVRDGSPRPTASEVDSVADGAGLEESLRAALGQKVKAAEVELRRADRRLSAAQQSFWRLRRESAKTAKQLSAELGEARGVMEAAKSRVGTSARVAAREGSSCRVEAALGHLKDELAEEQRMMESSEARVSRHLAELASSCDAEGRHLEGLVDQIAALTVQGLEADKRLQTAKAGAKGSRLRREERRALLEAKEAALAAQLLQGSAVEEAPLAAPAIASDAAALRAAAAAQQELEGSLAVARRCSAELGGEVQRLLGSLGQAEAALSGFRDASCLGAEVAERWLGGEVAALAREERRLAGELEEREAAMAEPVAASREVGDQLTQSLFSVQEDTREGLLGAGEPLGAGEALGAGEPPLSQRGRQEMEAAGLRRCEACIAATLALWKAQLRRLLSEFELWQGRKQRAVDAGLPPGSLPLVGAGAACKRTLRQAGALRAAALVAAAKPPAGLEMEEASQAHEEVHAEALELFDAGLRVEVALKQQLDRNVKEHSAWRRCAEEEARVQEDLAKEATAQSGRGRMLQAVYQGRVRGLDRLLQLQGSMREERQELERGLLFAQELALVSEESLAEGSAVQARAEVAAAEEASRLKRRQERDDSLLAACQDSAYFQDALRKEQAACARLRCELDEERVRVANSSVLTSSSEETLWSARAPCKPGRWRRRQVVVGVAEGSASPCEPSCSSLAAAEVQLNWRRGNLQELSSQAEHVRAQLAAAQMEIGSLEDHMSSRACRHLVSTLGKEEAVSLQVMAATARGPAGYFRDLLWTEFLAARQNLHRRHGGATSTSATHMQDELRRLEARLMQVELDRGRARERLQCAGVPVPADPSGQALQGRSEWPGTDEQGREADALLQPVRAV